MNFNVGGNFFTPTVKAQVRVQGQLAQTVKMYGVDENGQLLELQTQMCTSDSTVSFKAKVERFRTKRIEFKLFDSMRREIASASRPMN